MEGSDVLNPSLATVYLVPLIPFGMCLLLFVGEGPACTMTADEIEAQADHCNKKKKAAKTVEVSAVYWVQD